MKKCPECNKDVDDSLKVCPNCGYPFKKPNTLKKIMLPLIVVLVVVILFIVLIATHTICINHDWKSATCTEPKICKYCGKESGEPLGHEWKDATCTEPKTCSVCKLTEGETLEHNWKAATCTEPKTCILCNKSEGEALGHVGDEEVIITNATINKDGQKGKKCSVCGDNYDISSFTLAPGIDGEHFNFTPDDFEQYMNNIISNGFRLGNCQVKEDTYMYGLYQYGTYKDCTIGAMVDESGCVQLLMLQGSFSVALSAKIASAFDASIDENQFVEDIIFENIVKKNGIAYGYGKENGESFVIIKPDGVYIG